MAIEHFPICPTNFIPKQKVIGFCRTTGPQRAVHASAGKYGTRLGNYRTQAADEHRRLYL